MKVKKIKKVDEREDEAEVEEDSLLSHISHTCGSRNKRVNRFPVWAGVCCE